MILGTRNREAKIGLVADEQQLTLAHDRKQLILDRSVVSEELGGQYVDLYDFSDGELEVRWQGQLLPYRVFDKDQRVHLSNFGKAQRFIHPLSSRTRGHGHGTVDHCSFKKLLSALRCRGL